MYKKHKHLQRLFIIFGKNMYNSMAHLQRPYLCLLLLLLALACGDKKETGFTIEKIPDPMMHGGYVSNPDHLVSQETAAALNNQMQQLDQSGRAQVAIVLLETIGDKVPKDVAHEIFKLWKPGQKGKDNGLVVLLVNDQHRIEFETGYGLEGDLPDVICYRIQQSEMLPSFREKNIDEGMLKGMTALVNVLQSASEPGQVAEDHNPAPTDTSDAAVMKIGDAGSTAEDIESTAGEETSSDDPVADRAEPENDEPGIGSLILYVLYALFSLIFMIRPGIAKKRKEIAPLFRPNIWHKIWVFGLPLILLAILLNIPGNVYRSWMLPFILYCNLLVYLIYRAVVMNAKARVLLKDADRHLQYETLNVAHANSWVSSVFFPVPFLAYSNWHLARLNKLRYDPYGCETCHQPMTLLKKAKKKEALEPVQAVEDKVGSVTYDAWFCKKCQSKKVLGYRNLRSDVTACPSCNALTLVAGSSRVVRPATTSSEGEGIQHYLCKYCQYTRQETYTIAKLSSGGSSSGSSGSSSGSSSSSSSSGGWGGGSSGGGGAGSSW